jgi:F0F1-type ATP synthase membrane subunit c/vacuolar-type H+-ATPase subunit K
LFSRRVAPSRQRSIGTTRNPGTLSGARGMMILGLGMIESVLVLVAVFLMTKM